MASSPVSMEELTSTGPLLRAPNKSQSSTQKTKKAVINYAMVPDDGKV
jgi:hypothetical protein